MKKALLLAVIFVAFLALAGMAANLAGFAVDSAEPQARVETTRTLTMDTPAELPTKVKRSIKLHGQPDIDLDTSRELGAALLLGVTRSPWS